MTIVEDELELPFDFQVFKFWIGIQFKIYNFRVPPNRKDIVIWFPTRASLSAPRENLVYYNL